MSSFEDRLVGWLKGDEPAVAFVSDILDVAHFWDDLIDGDKELSAADVNSAMWKALVRLHENSFFSRHKLTLMPLIKLAVVNWHTANSLEESGDSRDLQVSFILRSSYSDIVTACAFLVGGRDWALDVASEVRLEASAEGFDAYMAALRDEKRKL